ncbi:hypothetical protein FACS1894161_5170 [Spirochaetia bacterium]|nr:hypothetical protein FACS1894161_5170 [Spirochaetia bacterium]
MEGQALKIESRAAPAPKGRRRGREDVPVAVSGEVPAAEAPIAETPAAEPAENAAPSEAAAVAE